MIWIPHQFFKNEVFYRAKRVCENGHVIILHVNDEIIRKYNEKSRTSMLEIGSVPVTV